MATGNSNGLRLTANQILMLRLLCGRDATGRGLLISEIARRTGKKDSSLIATLKSLRKRGLVELVLFRAAQTSALVRVESGWRFYPEFEAWVITDIGHDLTHEIDRAMPRDAA